MTGVRAQIRSFFLDYKRGQLEEKYGQREDDTVQIVAGPDGETPRVVFNVADPFKDQPLTARRGVTVRAAARAARSGSVSPSLAPRACVLGQRCCCGLAAPAAACRVALLQASAYLWRACLVHVQCASAVQASVRCGVCSIAVTRMSTFVAAGGR